MDETTRADGSHLFLVRLWVDEKSADADQPAACSGKVQHVMSGKAANFNGWSALMELLTGMMPHDPGQTAPTSENKG